MRKTVQISDEICSHAKKLFGPFGGFAANLPQEAAALDPADDFPPELLTSVAVLNL